MTTIKGVITREMLAEYFKDNPRLMRAFADQSEVVQQTSSAATSASVALQDASFVTLGPNDALTSERVLTSGTGIRIAIDDNAGTVTISLSSEAATVVGGFPVTFYVSADTNLQLPPAGTLATLSGVETLNNKTLQIPKFAGLGDYADDAAAATGGVPVGGSYRTGSTLKVRVA